MIDLFAVIARAGEGYFYNFANDAELWDELVIRGAEVRPIGGDCDTDQIIEQAELRIGRARICIVRTRKVTQTERRARIEAREERSRRDAQAIIDEGPVDVYRETDEKDRLMEAGK